MIEAITTPIEPHLIMFMAPDSTKLGKLTQQDGVLSFSGNVNDSAKVFFDAVISCNNKRLAELTLQNTLLQQRLENATRMYMSVQQELETINRTRNGT